MIWTMSMPFQGISPVRSSHMTMATLKTHTHTHTHTLTPYTAPLRPTPTRAHTLTPRHSSPETNSHTARPRSALGGGIVGRGELRGWVRVG